MRPTDAKILPASALPRPIPHEKSIRAHKQGRACLLRRPDMRCVSFRYACSWFAESHLSALPAERSYLNDTMNFALGRRNLRASNDESPNNINTEIAKATGSRLRARVRSIRLRARLRLGKQKPEIRRQMSEVGNQLSEVGGQRLAD